MDSIFATIFARVGPPIIGAVDGIIASLQGWMRPWLVSAVVLYVVGKMIWATLRGNGQPFGDAFAEMIAGSIIVYAATEAAGLGVQARNLLLSGISREVGGIVTGAAGAPAVGAIMFDDLWARSWATGLTVYNALPSFSVKAIGLSFVVVIYWFASLAAIGLAFCIWLTSYVMVALLIGLWPIGVGLFAFPWTRSFAWGWLRTIVSNVLLQILVTMTAATLLAVLTGVLQTLQESMPGTGARNEVREVGMLIGACLVAGLFGWLMKQLPGLAAAIAHGFTGFGHVPSLSMGFGSWLVDRSQGTSSTSNTRGGSQAAETLPPAMPRGAPPGQSLG